MYGLPKSVSCSCDSSVRPVAHSICFVVFCMSDAISSIKGVIAGSQVISLLCFLFV